MEIPVACTLESGEASERIEQWRRTLRGQVAAVDRGQPARIRLMLRLDHERIASLVHLAQQEKGCCPFFTFGLEIEAETVILVVGAPDEAAGLLDDFAALAEPQ
jgi:hypothetical protein